MKPISCIPTEQSKAVQEASKQTENSWSSATAPVPNDDSKHALGFGLPGVCSTGFMIEQGKVRNPIADKSLRDHLTLKLGQSTRDEFPKRHLLFVSDCHNSLQQAVESARK